MTYDSHQHERQLEQLLASIEELTPQQQAALGPLVDETRRRQTEADSNNAEALAALEDWRLAMKYFVFSSEARRREIN